MSIKQFSPRWKSCKARTRLFSCQEWPWKHISPLWRSGEAVPEKLVQGCLSVRRVLECSFDHCRGTAKLVHACFSVRRDPECSFHRCGGTVMLMCASISARRGLQDNFHLYGVCFSILNSRWQQAGLHAVQLRANTGKEALHHSLKLVTSEIHM